MMMASRCVEILGEGRWEDGFIDSRKWGWEAGWGFLRWGLKPVEPGYWR